MNSQEAFLVGVRWGHELLNMVTADLTSEQAAWIPPGVANPIGAQYAHAICAEDAIVKIVFQGRKPFYLTDWSGKTGVSDPQWNATFEWARSVKVDLPSLRAYAGVVAGETEKYITSLSDTDFDTSLDLTAFDVGEQTIGWALHALLIGHLHNMAGEISALKGLQGAKGYPF